MGHPNRGLQLRTHSCEKPEDKVIKNVKSTSRKQLDYILTEQQFLRYCVNAESSALVHLNSDHRAVQLQQILPKTNGCNGNGDTAMARNAEGYRPKQEKTHGRTHQSTRKPEEN